MVCKLNTNELSQPLIILSLGQDIEYFSANINIYFEDNYCFSHICTYLIVIIQGRGQKNEHKMTKVL